MSARRLRALVRRVVAEIRRDRPVARPAVHRPDHHHRAADLHPARGRDARRRRPSLVNQAGAPRGWPSPALEARSRTPGVDGDRRGRRGGGPGRGRGRLGDRWRSCSRRTSRRRRPTIRVITTGPRPGRRRRPSSARSATALTDGPRRGARAPPARRSSTSPSTAPAATTRWCRSRPRIVALLRLLLRLPADRRQLPARADRRDARAADGDAGHPRRDRDRLHARVRAVRDDPGRGAADLGAGHGPRPGDRAAAGVLDRARRSRSPAARLLAFLVVVAARRWARSASGSSCRRSPAPSSRSSSSSRS